MENLGFMKCVGDPCVFVKENIIVGTFDDDVLSIGLPVEVASFKRKLSETVTNKDLGPVSSLFSIQCC